MPRLTALRLASFAAAPTVRALAPETGAESAELKAKTGTTSVAFGYRPEGMTKGGPGLSHTRGECICATCSGSPTDQSAPPPRPITSASL